MNYLDYWKEFSLVVGAVVSFFFGRKSAKIIEKQQQAEAVQTMQKTYDLFLLHYKEQYEKLVGQVENLQLSFSELQIVYKKELEISKNWEEQHKELEKKYESLEKLYNKLKADFEKHKKIIQ